MCWFGHLNMQLSTSVSNLTQSGTPDIISHAGRVTEASSSTAGVYHQFEQSNNILLANAKKIHKQ